MDELLHNICSSSIMPIPEYSDRGPVRIPSNVDLKNLVDKSVVITGGNISQTFERNIETRSLTIKIGASGLGLAYTKAFIDAGLGPLLPASR